MNPSFRKKEWNRLIRYLALLRDDMRLRNWRIEVCDETPQEVGQDERALAYVEPNDAHYSARVYLSSEFIERDPEMQREVLVHELIHMHFRDVAAVWDELGEVLGTATFNVVIGLWKQKNELLVQEMALLIAPAYRLPKIRKEKKP